MPDDTQINQAAGQGDQKPTDAGEKPSETGAGEKPVPTETGKGEDAGKEGEGEKGEKATSQEDKTKAPKPQDDTSQLGKDEGEEPAVRPRLTPKDFIIQRKDKKIEKLKEKTGEGEEITEGDEEEEVDPGDEKLITKVVSKKFAPIFDKTIQAEDEREIAAFLKENPDFIPFEAKAKRYMAHPSRRHLPVETIFFEVAGKGLLKIGAERQKQADQKAKETQTGGGSTRGGEGGKNVWDLPKEDFEAKQEKIRRGQS